MLWFFTRDAAQVDIEVRRVPHSDAFDLIVDYPDGSESVERFHDARKLVKRTLSVQHQLIRDGWVPTSPGQSPRRAAVQRVQGNRVARAKMRAVPRMVWTYVQRQVRQRIAATFGL
jgi:hypothetical protein